MTSKKYTINIKETENENEKDIKFEICEICRKYLGKYDTVGNVITWKNLFTNNCYCSTYY